MNTPIIKRRSRKRIIFNCDQCGKLCNAPAYRRESAKYCSRQCTALAMRIKYTTKCEICSKEFEHIGSRCNKAKYCSQKCYHRSQIGRGHTEYECHHCHKKFKDSLSKKRKFCSMECNNKSSKQIWKGVFSTVRKNMKTRNMFEKCQLCGFNDNINILGVHHIDKNRNNNEISNLLILCPNCHSMQHNKHIVH